MRANKKVPLIVWSHGLGGSVDGASFLSRFITSHGYVVLHVQHHGTDSSLWEGKPGHPWDIIRAQKIDRQATLNRFKDTPFVLDALPDWLEQHPHIKSLIDFDTIGMSGHSFGALTTQVLGGMMFPDKKGILRRNRETRFKAGILYSPSPIDHIGLDAPEDVYGSIDMPMLHMTGTDDSSPVENWDYQKRLDVYNNITEAPKHLLIIKDGDHMVFNGSRGKLGQNPNREKHEMIIKILALAYWDAMLKKDADAQEWLEGDALQNWLGDDGSFE
jgi:predicted dienelactone hydrolase